MVNYRELRLKCEVCEKCMIWNANKACNECEIDNRSAMVTNSNKKEQERNEVFGSKRGNTEKQKERNMNKVDRTKVKGLA